MTRIHTNHSFTLEDMSGAPARRGDLGRPQQELHGRGRQAQPRRPHQRARPCCRSGVAHAAADRRVAHSLGIDLGVLGAGYSSSTKGVSRAALADLRQ
jgi:hypothetical protein